MERSSKVATTWPNWLAAATPSQFMLRADSDAVCKTSTVTTNPLSSVPMAMQKQCEITCHRSSVSAVPLLGAHNDVQLADAMLQKANSSGTLSIWYESRDNAFIDVGSISAISLAWISPSSVHLSKNTSHNKITYSKPKDKGRILFFLA